MKKLFSTEPKTQSPARLIVKLEDSPTEAFLDYLKELGYETSRGFLRTSGWESHPLPDCRVGWNRCFGFSFICGYFFQQL